MTVLAASSLTEVFTEIGRDFERANPGVRVRLSFGGSATLARQIIEGAPADVFAAADAATMRRVAAAADAAGPATVFARNRLVLAVPAAGSRVGRLADLGDRANKVALCAPAVPCGAAARTALTAAGVRVAPVTLEQDVKAVLAKVAMGEVDAGLVYRTDVRPGAGRVRAIEFAESARAINDYPIVVLDRAARPGRAAAFVDHVRSARGAAVLRRAGFSVP